MMLLKKLLGRAPKAPTELRGEAPAAEPDANQDLVRQKMESEVMNSKAKREAKNDAPPPTNPPA